MHTALDATFAGTPAVVVLHGERGVGKSATAAEFASQARARGARVMWGGCYQYEGGLPYCPWGEAIDRYVDGLDPDALAALVGSDADVLATLTPKIDGSVERAPPDPRPGDGAQEVSEAIVRLLDSVGGPLVLVLDDLQWAPPVSLDVLSAVARGAHAPMIVAIYRGRELDISYPLARALGELNRRHPSEYVLLEGLSEESSSALLEDVSGALVAPEIAAAIYRSTGGVPFFLHELGNQLHGPASVPGDADWRAPEPIRQAVALSLADLSFPGRGVLELATIAGDSFTFEELGMLVELDEPALLLIVEEALAADVIRPSGGERYEFAHAIVRHTLYGNLSPSRRARLHRRFAEGLERLHERHTADVAAELARQYYGSATLPGSEQGIAHAVVAAAQARSAHRPLEAVEFGRIALDLAADADTSTRSRLMQGLALAQAEAGMIGEAEQSLEATLSLYDEAGTSPEIAAGLVHEVISKLKITLPHQNSLETLIAEGIAGLGHDHGLAWARLKLLERPHEPFASGDFHFVRWDGLDPEAVRVARAEGSDDDYPRTIDWHSPLSPAALDDLVARIGLWRDPAVRLTSLIAVTHHLFLARGPTSDVERLCARCDALAEELGSAAGRAAAAIQRAMVAGEQGRFEAAGASIAEATSLARDLDPESQLGVAVALVGGLTLQHAMPEWGNAADAARRLASVSEPVFWGIACAAFACHAFAQAGEANHSRELLAQIVPALTAGGVAPYARSAALSLAASAVWELREPDLAEELLDCALSHNVDGDWYMASGELATARLATVLGRGEQAFDYFERARGTFADRGQRPLRAVVDYDEAIARGLLRRPGASPLLAAAKSQFTDLGMTEWLGRVAREESSAVLPDDLTPREAEVLRLVATGSTNKEIAEALVLSVHTVERHVTNAYRKIGMRNRADATAYVLQKDL